MRGCDPVALGLVPSLARPGGNVTGAMLFAQSLMSKRLELLHQLMPNGKAFGLLVNPDSNALDVYVSETEKAAQALGVALQVLPVSSADEIDAVFIAATDRGAAFARRRGDFMMAHERARAHHRQTVVGARGT